MGRNVRRMKIMNYSTTRVVKLLIISKYDCVTNNVCLCFIFLI